MEKRIRLTKENVEKILKENVGKRFETYYSDKNFRESNVYVIKEDGMYKKSNGKTSWADSHFTNEERCDIETTRGILKKFYDKLDLSEFL